MSLLHLCIQSELFQSVAPFYPVKGEGLLGSFSLVRSSDNISIWESYQHLVKSPDPAHDVEMKTEPDGAIVMLRKIS